MSVMARVNAAVYARTEAGDVVFLNEGDEVPKGVVVGAHLLDNEEPKRPAKKAAAKPE